MMVVSRIAAGILGIAKVTQPICMAFFKGVTETTSAQPLSAANMSSIITVRLTSH